MSKPLYECDPKELPDDDLNDLYRGLVAKLAIVADELVGRRENFVAASSGLLTVANIDELQKDERQRLMQDLQKHRASMSRLKRFRALIVQELQVLKAKIEKDREQIEQGEVAAHSS
jgi:hypothetical protein